MKTELYFRNDGGFEIVCRESYPSGFTNHRVTVARNEQGFTCSDSRAQSKSVLVPDLAGVSAWMRFECCLANGFIAAAAQRAMQVLADQPETRSRQPVTLLVGEL